MKKYDEIINIIDKVCKEENKKLENSDFEYEVLQLSDLNNDLLESAYLISKFYNENFSGNADYMHIPNFTQTLKNIMNYPIIIARLKNSKNILGISILKYNESDKEFDPYFPIENSKYFSVTGILTNKENKNMGVYGLGKKIYEIALKSVLEYKKKYSDTKLMCVIDCRNTCSINALKVATNNLNSNYEDKQIDSRIIGYYKVENEKEKYLEEAPTFVIEMKMEDTDCENNNEVVVSYDNSSETKEQSYLKMKKTIDSLFLRDNNSKIVESLDPGCGVVTYYPLKDDLYCLNNITIYSNGTEKGNDRVPLSKEIFDLNVKKSILTIMKNTLPTTLDYSEEYEDQYVKKF